MSAFIFPPYTLIAPFWVISETNFVSFLGYKDLYKEVD